MGKIVRQFVAENAINGPRSMTGTWLRVGSEQTHIHTQRKLSDYACVCELPVMGATSTSAAAALLT